jgi:NADH dehydrogenase
VTPRVVIVGAGFAGLHAARGLADVPVEVTLVDRHNFHTFLPMLYQVATAGLNPADVAYPVRGIFHRQPNVEFRQASVTGVDWDTRHVELEGDDRLPFDYLVVAAGAVVNTFDLPGTEHAFPLYTLADAVVLRNHVLARFEAAHVDRSLVDQGALTVVVVGGGPTGVELAGALTELLKVLRRDFPRLEVDRARIVLLEMAPDLLGPFQPLSQRHALETLRSRGVEVLLGEAMASMSSTEVTLRSGEVIPTHTVAWSAGVQANPLAAALGIETGRGGRIVVDRGLRIPGHLNAFAAGDVAEIVAPALGRWRLPWRPRQSRGPAPIPQVAQLAMQSGDHVARQIAADLEDRPARPFVYIDKGIMATIGRRSAVTELPVGLSLKGTLAWLAWLGLHIFYLIGFRNRASVLLNWSWNYLTYDRGARLIFDARDAGELPRR